jgi:hypothetical protein
MNLEPVKQKMLFHEEGETLDRLLEVCDSYIAVLTPEQVDECLAQFEKHVDFEFTDFGSATLVFDIGGKLQLAIVEANLLPESFTTSAKKITLLVNLLLIHWTALDSK